MPIWVRVTAIVRVSGRADEDTRLPAGESEGHVRPGRDCDVWGSGREGGPGISYNFRNSRGKNCYTSVTKTCGFWAWRKPRCRIIGSGNPFARTVRETATVCIYIWAAARSTFLVL